MDLQEDHPPVREDAPRRLGEEPGAQELQATSRLLTKPASNQQSRKQPQYEADLLSVWLSESKSSHKPSNSIDAPVSSVPRNIHIPHSSQDPCDLDHRKVAQCPDLSPRSYKGCTVATTMPSWCRNFPVNLELCLSIHASDTLSHIAHPGVTRRQPIIQKGSNRCCGCALGNWSGYTDRSSDLQTCALASSSTWRANHQHA
ncbi:hypothetical protein WJX74_003367 [Apatococcus lobatus]|uniref:Uncharacterized protein n=1 Tax=Apatococcus lobatus TaxID=904363 RepID=A0AAW1QD32_9CHLO